MRWLCACLLLAPLSLSNTYAGDLQFWNQTEFTLVQAGRTEWKAFGVLRTRNHVTEAYDSRVGTLVSFALTPRLSLGAGYLSRWLDPDGRGAHQENRIYGGPTVRLLEGPMRLQSVTLYERHIGVRSQPDFNRYKQRLEFEKASRKSSPFLSSEVAFWRHGFLRWRSMAGLRWRFESGRSFEVGYQFESIRTGGALAPRHAIRTNFNLGKLWP